MFERFRLWLLELLCVPAQPEAPFGAPGSVRVFRAAPNFYRLKLAIWAVGQVATLVGILLSLVFLAQLKAEADLVRSERRAAAAAQAASTPDNANTAGASQAKPAAPPGSRREAIRGPFDLWRVPLAFVHDPNNPFGRLIERSPWWLFPGIALLEFLGVAFFLVQLPVTYALVRLEFESHWYIVTDRSLRIRWGLISLREATMSFANIQQVTVSQGPVQRLLGLADVHVKSAGGGGGGDDHKGQTHDAMHEGVFHGVANAAEIRDLILARLRRFRAAGLGDPEEPEHAAANASTADVAAPPGSAALDAAHALLAEARALRKAVR